MKLFYIRDIATGEVWHDTTFTTEALARNYAETMGMLVLGKYGKYYDSQGEAVAIIRTLRMHVE